MPAEHMDRLFNAFFTPTKSIQGNGLGLSICRSISKLTAERLSAFRQ